jgi:predicted glycoside hydrolase/deacetylase ChbG (UPF0249 family)
METIKQILMRRDGLDSRQADLTIQAAKAQLDDYLQDDDLAAAYEVFIEFLGLEPDYIDELLTIPWKIKL